MDNWQPGDLALCVRPEMNARAGGVYSVESVFYDYGHSDTAEGWGLAFSDLEPTGDNGGYDAWRFHRIPPHKADAEDRETIELLTGKPLLAPVVEKTP